MIDRILDEDHRVPKKQRHTAKRIFERLGDEYGFDGGYTVVKDYVREHRRQTREMFVPLSHPPGQAQCDFGEALVTIGGVQRKAHFFVLDLPHSDGCFVKAYPAETTEAFLDGHVSAFSFLGGIPQSILYDNTKLAVAKILGDGKRQRTRAFTELQSHYLFEDRFGRPGKGNDKGKVEGLVGYTRRNFLVPIPSFESFDALNAYLERRCLERMDAKPTEQQLFTYSFTLPTNSRKYLNQFKEKQQTLKTASLVPHDESSDPAKENRKQRSSSKEPKPKRTPMTPKAKEAATESKALGLCKDCHEPAIEGQTSCGECERLRKQQRERQQEAHRQSEKQRREKLTAAGLCRDCRGQPIPNQTRCEECAEKHRVQRRKNDADRRARIKAEKDQNKEK